jgi:acetyltransferase-like isoleucine patch superfamily enzyme
VVEIVLTREDANTESGLLVEWLVPDREQVRKGQPVCVVETTKATVELEAPENGTIVQLHPAGTEVELGRSVGLIAENAEDLEAAGRATDRREPEQAPAATGYQATRKAVVLAEAHGIDLGSIDKRGFITTEDVEAAIAQQAAAPAEAETVADPLLAGISLDGVSFPASFAADETVGTLQPDFLELLRSDPDGFGALSSEEKCEAYRSHGASIGAGVTLGQGTLLIAPRIMLGDGVVIGDDARVECSEVVALGALTSFRSRLSIACRRAFVGEGIWAGEGVRIGGGGHGDPRAIVSIGDQTFLGDEVFINVARPVLVGREAFVTQRTMIVTHNIGHSVLDGFENRFAPVVIEDFAQVGLATIVYAGCRIGRGAIVASNSYVVSDIHPGRLAIGVPARDAGAARRDLSRSQQLELLYRMLDELHEQLRLQEHDATLLEGPLRGLRLRTGEGRALVVALERLDGPVDLPAGGIEETVVLALELEPGRVPDGYVVFDLLQKRIHGESSPLVDSVREFCRKRGIRLEPGPWRFSGGPF